MVEITLDPIGYSEALQKAGMPKAQADVIARTQEAAIEDLAARKELATKADLREMELRLLKHMSDLDARQTQRMFNMLLAFAGAIGAFFAIAAFFLKA